MLEAFGFGRLVGDGTNDVPVLLNLFPQICDVTAFCEGGNVEDGRHC